MSQIDKRNRFAEDIFSYQATKSGKVFISFHGKQVTILQGKPAEKFLVKIKDADRRSAQLIMAKATGHFKHGNERK
jgi:hypothetical protein